MTKFLITGLGGFQATHVAYKLLKQGHEIAGICSPREHSVKNLKLLAKHTTPEEHTRLQVVFGSIEDKNLINRMVEECDMVLHTAAKIHVDESINNPNEFFETNIKATYEMLNTVNKHNKKILHWSTCEVYGGNHTTEFIYEDHPLLPMSPYASSKAAGDCIAHSYHETYGTNVVVIRPGNIYGPLQKSEKHASVIPIFFRKATHNEDITIHGTGEQKRDFVYITDLVTAVTKIIDNFDKYNGKIVNIGTGEQVTIKYLAETITELTCSKGKVKHVDERPGQVTTFYLKSKVMPYETKVTIKEGLTKYDTFLKTGMPFEK